MSPEIKKIFQDILDLDKDGQLTIKDLFILIGLLSGALSAKQEKEYQVKGLKND